jgi:hypothetical protein
MPLKKIKTIADLNTQEFLLFYRHWKWAEMVRDQYLKAEMDRGIILFFEPKNGFKFLWYGLLNALIEFVGKTHICIPSIAEEIRRVRKPLRLFRNSVFHILPEKNEPVLMPDSFSNLLMDQESEGNILKIHSEIGKSLQEDFKRRLAEVPPKVKMMFNITEAMPEEYLIRQLYFMQGYHL